MCPPPAGSSASPAPAKKARQVSAATRCTANSPRPHGVTIHPVTSELFITDSHNNRVLKIVRK